MSVTTTHYIDAERFTQVEHEGLVVAVTSVYIGDGDSHYTAIYWDYSTAAFAEHGLGYDGYDAKVDAPEDLMDLYAALSNAKLALSNAKLAMLDRAQEEQTAERERNTVGRGKLVEVVRGRKVKVGTMAICKVACDGQWGARVLLTLADGTEVWTSESNVEVSFGSADDFGLGA